MKREADFLNYSPDYSLNCKTRSPITNDDDNNNHHHNQEKERNKIGGYNDLKYRYKMIGLWECNKLYVILMTFSALGMVHRGLVGWLQNIDIKKNLTILQKACLLGTARTLGYVFNTWRQGI